jgi:6-phosphogluconolactonase (cycloisomerase 2 family)
MTITPLPPAPSRTDPANFSERADASLGALPTFVTEANQQEQQVAADRIATAASASIATGAALDAINAAQVSTANINFKGLWENVSGAAVVPYSVFHEGKFWRLLVNLANVTTSEPSNTNPNWKESAVVSEIRTPIAIEPLNGSTGIVPAPTLEASAYAPLYSVDDRLHRRFEVSLATDPNFTSPVFTSEIDANSVTVSPLLAINTAHIWRCKDVVELPDSTLLESDWMVTQSFVTANIFINQPTLTVQGAPSDVPENPELTTSAFSTTPTGEDTHAATDWEVRKTSDNSLVYSSLNDTVNLLSIVVPAGNLEVDTEYKFRARHIGTIYGAGPFAEVTAKTEEVFDITPLLAVAHFTSPFVTIYNQEIDTFTKLDNPATLPASIGISVSFSSDDTYMAVAHDNSPFVTIYKRNIDTFTKLANPSALPTGTGSGVAFSSDDTYLAISHVNSPFVTIYKRDGDTFTKLTNPATLPAGNAQSVSFSSDDTYLAVAHSTSPFITIYKRSGDTFTKLTNPTDLPASTGNRAAFSSNDVYLAVAHNSSPFVTIYKRDGDTFTKLTNPANLPAGNGQGVNFSNNNVYLTVAHDGSPFITIYKRDADTFTKLANPTNLPANDSFDVAFSSDDIYMAVTHTGTPFITIYKRDGDTFTKLANPATLPAGNGRGIAFSNTGFPQ